jgi:hypothetical protein
MLIKSLLFLLSLLINLSKHLWIRLSVIFCCFLSAALVYKYWWVKVLAILGGLMSHLFGNWNSTFIIKCLAAIVSI